MTIKNILLILMLGIVIGGLIVYKLVAPNSKQQEQETKVIENTRYIDRIIKGKDGETIVERITEIKKEVEEKIKPVVPRVRLGLIADYDFNRKEMNYGVSVAKPLNHNLDVGVYVKPNAKELGVMVSWGF